MPRIRSTPEATVEVAIDTVEYFGVDFTYNTNGTLRTSDFVFVIRNRSADGKVVETHRRTVPVVNWPPGLKQQLSVILSRVLADAEADGLIGAGPDVGKFDP